MKDLERSEPCEECGLTMEHIIRFNGHMSPDKWVPEFNPAFGKTFSSRGSVKEEIKRIKEETGREIIETGNESLKIRKVKKTLYSDEAHRELRRLWR